MSAAKFNMRNPAVKRIMQEIKEMQSETSTDFIADALEDDIFEWHFVVRGPPDTEFEGGVYHGRILLPPEYPFKPPSFMMLTPNGRFQTGVKICLSISSHHPEHWQPSWSVRTALTALIAFMPTPGQGALGSLDFTKDERKKLALISRTEVPKFGSQARQKVITDMHQRMLKLQQQAAVPSSSSSGSGSEKTAADSAAPAAAVNVPLERKPSLDAAPAGAGSTDQDSSKQQQQLKQQSQQNTKPLEQQAAAKQEQQQCRQHDVQSTVVQDQCSSYVYNAAQQHAAAHQVAAEHQTLQLQRALAAGSRPGDLGDKGLTFLAVVLSVAIAAVLLKKVMTAMSGYRLFVDM